MEGSSSDGRYGAGRCALVAELVQMQGMVRHLEAQMGPQGGGGGGGAAMAGADERCRALVSGMLSSIDRSISIARSCCAEAGRQMQPAGAAPESPSSADGSAGSDHGADSRCRANAAGPCKKRKTLPTWSKQVRVSSMQDVGPLDDRFSWRKYGQKDILGAKYPRAYFRCTHRHTQGCHASKQVQRADGDPLLFDVVYHGEHTCAQGARSVVDGQARPRPAASAEQQPPPPPQPGQEQNAVSVAFKPAKDEGGVQALEPTSRPFAFTSTAEGGGGAGALLHGCAVLTASSSPVFMSPATLDCQVSGCVCELGGGSMTGVRNVPDVELASKTNSSMGDDMEFMFALDADFLDKYPGYF